MITSRLLLFILFAIITSCSSNSKEKQEQLNANNEKSVKKVSIKEIEEGIKAYIDLETQQHNGYFLINDSERNLKLKLVRVHTEYLSNLGPNRHFACVDLADEKGDVYDVDFFLEGEPGNMTVTETSLHKLNGKPCRDTYRSCQRNKK
jgi:hypothetical protein